MKRLLLASVALLLLGIGSADSQIPAQGNLVSGAGTTTGTGATTIIAAPTASGFRIYVTGVQCARDDAGTTAMRVTLNDTSSTVIVLPNSGGGGGNNQVYQSPLTVARTTALTFTASSGITNVYCNAQGYAAN